MAERAAAVKNLIVQAQKLDASGDEQGANRHYLLCVQAISQFLQSAPPGSQGELSQQKTKQLYQMARQCLERSESLSDSLRATHGAEAAQKQHVPVTPPVPAPRRLVAWTGDPRGTLSSSIVQASIAQPLAATQHSVPLVAVQRQPQVTKQVSQPSHLHSLTPIQAAAMKNKLLMEQYQASIRTTANSKVAPSFRGLEHLRRLDENMSVARIQERTIAQKQKLNEMRAQHSSKSSSPLVRLDVLSIPELCALVSKYNQEHGKHTNTPTSQHHDSLNVYNFVNEILSSSDHPLARLMGECQNSVLAVLRPVAQAVHTLNGLPYIEIRLAERSRVEHSESQPGHSHTQHPYFPEEEADAHMDLLCSEDDLFAMAGPQTDQVPPAKTTPTDQVTPAKTTPTDQVTSAETCLPTEDRVTEDVLTDKLNLLRKALLGESVEEGAREGGRGKSGDGQEGGEHTVGGACFSQPVPTRGSYCLEGPEAISPVTTKSKAPVAGAHVISSPDSIPHGPESVHSGSLPSGPDSIPPVDPASFPPPSPDCTQHSPDFTPGGPDSIPHDSSSIPIKPGITHGAPEITYQNTTDDSSKEPSLTTSPQSISSAGATCPQSIDSTGGTGPQSISSTGTTGSHSSGSPCKPSSQSTAEMLGQYAMLGPEAKVGTSPTGAVPGMGQDGEEEGGVVFRSLPHLTCTLHAEREAEMGELELQYRDVLKEVFKQIHSSLEKLEAGFTQAYPWLATEENTEYCQAVVEANFFPVIMPYLQTAFRCVKYSSEMAVARSMCHHVNATPKDLSVRRKFWLLEQAHAPFGEAIEEVRQIPDATYLSSKLGTLVNMSKSIIGCIEGYYKTKDMPSADLAVGVDDMLPIMTYIILRSAKPDLVSECALMEEFIQQGYMMGEEGFCLTSFRTALLFIAQMSS